MRIVEENHEKVIELQMKTISKLQDEIKLQKFDLSALRNENRSLKEKLRCRKENIKNIRSELMKMKRKDDFSNINSVLAMINEGWEEEYEQ